MSVPGQAPGRRALYLEALLTKGTKVILHSNVQVVQVGRARQTRAEAGAFAALDAS